MLVRSGSPAVVAQMHAHCPEGMSQAVPGAESIAFYAGEAREASMAGRALATLVTTGRKRLAWAFGLSIWSNACELPGCCVHACPAPADQQAAWLTWVALISIFDPCRQLLHHIDPHTHHGASLLSW